MLFGKRGAFSAGHAEAGGLDHQLEVLGTARGLEGLLVVDPVLFDPLKDACRLSRISPPEGCSLVFALAREQRRLVSETLQTR
jgi:hypothetical protein